MIKLYNNSEQLPFVDYSNFFLVYNYDGLVDLSFDISPKHELYKYIKEEMLIEFDENYYLIKTINERANTSTITAELDLDSLKVNVYTEYNSLEKRLQEVFDEILLGTGWTAINTELVMSRRTLNLTDVNTFDIIQTLYSLYGVAFKFNCKSKTITVSKPEYNLYKGQYFTDELNLQSIEFKGDSRNFITRLYPFGKTDDDTGITVDITSVNDGIPYIDNTSYSNKIVSAVWRDDRYIVPQQLKDDAIEKLKQLSVPTQSYSLNVLDIAKLDDTYNFLEINLYDKFKLIDRNRNTTIIHEVVEYKQYPDYPERNVVKLSSVPQTINITITKISNMISDINTDMTVTKNRISEIKQDVDGLAVRVAETYTKGETDANIESAITVAKDEINTTVSETYVTKTGMVDYVGTEIRQTKDDITFDLQNGGLSTTVEFTTNGQTIYNGDLAIYDKPKTNTSKQKVFSYNRVNETLEFKGDLYLNKGSSIIQDKYSGEVTWNLETSANGLKILTGNGGMTVKTGYSWSQFDDLDAQSVTCTSLYVNGNPSGIIRGSGYTKFPDGTMIVTQQLLFNNVTCNTAWGNLYYGKVYPVNFPQAFLSLSAVSVWADAAGSAWAQQTTPAPSTTGVGNITILRPTTGVVSVNLHIIAIGRWM